MNDKHVMSVDVTWPRTTPISEAEKLLREIFEYLDIDLSKAEIGALQTMVERYKRK